MFDKETHQYNDIINMPHPNSCKHPRMSIQDRAAQFAPFAALTGYGDAVKETARLTENRIELNVDEKAILDEKLRIIQDNIGTAQLVTFTYFVPDDKKSGGEYMTYTGRVKKIDVYEHSIIMYDKTVIPMEDIVEIESENNI